MLVDDTLEHFSVSEHLDTMDDFSKFLRVVIEKSTDLVGQILISPDFTNNALTGSAGSEDKHTAGWIFRFAVNERPEGLDLGDVEHDAG
ncbi:MAG: hypothetical protein BWY66_00031 [bacterium ADurb.Bin374]|nr:MAG: hypothetical protein BWY66_00031 [bacterium ADurb.Bin374]